MKSPLKLVGGRFYTRQRILDLFPPRDSYLTFCEPYAGTLSVLFAHDPTDKSEVVNDLNPWLSAYWRAMQDPQLFAKFVRQAQATPFREKVFHEALERQRRFPNMPNEGRDSVVVAAFTTFVLCRMSRAGNMKSFTTATTGRTRRGMNAEVAAWLTSIEGLSEVHARLQRVLLVGPKEARQVIRDFDKANTVLYLDPPWHPDARSDTEAYGAYEMGDDDHHDLLTLLATVKARFLLSGYRVPLYDRFAKNNKWRRVDFRVPDQTSQGTNGRAVKTESVWLNY